MARLSWRLSPKDFVVELRRLKSVWLRQPGGRSSARRRAGELARDRIKWYRRLTGAVDLRLGLALQSSDEWRELSPDDLMIVMTPRGDDRGPTALPSRAEGRRVIRTALHEVRKEDGPQVELLASRRVASPGAPVVAQGVRSGRPISRGIFLEALGIAILPKLSRVQVELLERSGTIVLANERVEVGQPAVGPKTRTPDKWHLNDIQVQAAWTKGYRGKGALIGVLDTGIDAKHPEFKGKTIYYRAFNPDGSRKKTKKAKDFAYHGTHVAGLCAGASVGVAPEADLAVAAVVTHRDLLGRMIGYRGQFLAGLNWLAKGEDGLPRTVDVLNASLTASPDIREHETIANARLVGLNLIAAIGNGGESGLGHHGAPAMYDCALAVGSCDAAGNVSKFSAWGQSFSYPAGSPDFKPDLMAPGEGVVSAVPGTKYAPMSGTSMAAPIVAGVAALLIGNDHTLKAEPDALAARIFDLVRPLQNQPTGFDVRRGGRGALDLSAV